MAKKALLLLLLFMVTACGARHVEEKRIEIKKEMPMWRIVMYKEAGSDVIRHEDKWYLYSLELKKVIKGRFNYTNRLYGECRYDGGAYTVIDRGTGQVVREDAVVQRKCNSCHKRF
jgi:hypothetical protein